ncbi:lysophospholipid acyltransferase family protein [Maribacter aestuarii]|uniref:lysophospholipid acyltransferase family protein n=1 Tax=Maribacter aestuarii TaxID=1130723 RepID=UPI00248C86BD|nr:lysophospholipid acyltransferase family protein [Maribacter aestuarii]
MKNLLIIKYLPFYTMSILPMPVLYLLSDLSFILIYYIVGYRKKVVFGNLKSSFPEKNYREIQKIARDFYRHFCDLIFESIKSLTISRKEVKKRLRIENPELVQHYLKSRKDILLYAAHQGNWEWLIFLPLFFPYYSTTFYRPLKNNYFNGLLRLIRQRFGVNLIEEKNGYRTISKLKKAQIPLMNCMIGDQSPTRKSAKYWHPFLNRTTAFLKGPDIIARKTDQIVLFPNFKKIKRGYYQLTFDLIADNPQSNYSSGIVKKYARKLEITIKNSPELWLWSHRRWKLSP